MHSRQSGKTGPLPFRAPRYLLLTWSLPEATGSATLVYPMNMDVLPPVALGPASSPWTAPPPKSRPDSSKASFAPAFPNLQHGLFLHCVSSSDLDLCRVAAHMDAHTSVKPSVGVPMDAHTPL